MSSLRAAGCGVYVRYGSARPDLQVSRESTAVLLLFRHMLEHAWPGITGNWAPTWERQVVADMLWPGSLQGRQ